MNPTSIRHCTFDSRSNGSAQLINPNTKKEITWFVHEQVIEGEKSLYIRLTNVDQLNETAIKNIICTIDKDLLLSGCLFPLTGKSLNERTIKKVTFNANGDNALVQMD